MARTDRTGIAVPRHTRNDLYAAAVAISAAAHLDRPLNLTTVTEKIAAFAKANPAVIAEWLVKTRQTGSEDDGDSERE